MGKKGIPMTVVMQSPAYVGNEPKEDIRQGLVGSLFYDQNGKAVATASAWKASNGMTE